MNDSEKQKIQQAIQLLQQALTGKSGGLEHASKHSVRTFMATPELDAKIHHFAELSEKLEPDMKEASNLMLKGLKRMKNYLDWSENCQKPDKQTVQKMVAQFTSQAAALNQLDRANQFKEQMKTIKEALNIPLWVFSPDPIMQIDSATEPMEYYANKFRGKGIPGHFEWYGALKDISKLLRDVVDKYYTRGLEYYPKGTGNWNDYLQGKGLGSGGDAPKTASTSAGSAQSTVAPVAEQPKPKAPEQAATAPKKPIREKRGLANWHVENHTDQVITFDENEVEMKTMMMVSNCKKCTIDLSKTKFKSLMLKSSDDVVLKINSCITGIEIISVNNVRVYVIGNCPSISIDRSKGTKIIVNQKNKNLEILTTLSSETNVELEGDGDMENVFTISNQLSTKWNDKTKKFETHSYEVFL